jgi:hypothetical protein
MVSLKGIIYSCSENDLKTSKGNNMVTNLTNFLSQQKPV